jgi:hypothetical protein
MRLRIVLALFASLAAPLTLSAQPKALAELFSNFNCKNCRTPDDQYSEYLKSHPEIVLINYHNSNTDPNDDFFNKAKPSSENRDDFYSGGGDLTDPVAFVDGIFAGTGSNTEPQWETFSNLSLQHPLPVINPSTSIDGEGIIHIHFIVNGSTGAQVRAYAALLESNIYFGNNQAYGNPPDSLWNNVFRGMLPTATGSDPFTFSGAKEFDFTYDPQNFSTYSSDWNVSNMKAVVFIQDVNASAGGNNSHQVEAIGTASLAVFGGVTDHESAPSSRLIIPSNPMSSSRHIGFALPIANHVTITLSNMLGSDVRALADGMMPEGQTSIEMDRSLPAGCYIARLLVDGREADHAKLIVLP